MKHLKVSQLDGQYADYRFIKEWTKRLTAELHYRGPDGGCNANVFAHCYAAASANATADPARLNPASFDWDYAAAHYPQCVTEAKCTPVVDKMTPADRAALENKARANDQLLTKIF